MLYQLPNGKTIEISTEDYLSLTDAELQDLVAGNYGLELNKPFFHSALESKSIREIDKELSDKELPDIDIDDKINDQDYDYNESD